MDVYDKLKNENYSHFPGPIWIALTTQKYFSFPFFSYPCCRAGGLSSNSDVLFCWPAAFLFQQLMGIMMLNKENFSFTFFVYFKYLNFIPQLWSSSHPLLCLIKNHLFFIHVSLPLLPLYILNQFHLFLWTFHFMLPIIINKTTNFFNHIYLFNKLFLKVFVFLFFK